MSYFNGVSMLDEMPCAVLEPGENKPGMTLQRLEDREWVDFVVDGEVVKSPVDIGKLPAGRYRLFAP